MDDIYASLCIDARKHKMFYHYTTISSLERILATKTIKLSRLENVNDIFESARIIELWKSKIYVACFTHRESESIPFWQLYAKGDMGIRIGLPNFISGNYIIKSSDGHIFSEFKRSDINHKQYDKSSDWGYYDITIADIKYTDDFSKYTKDNEHLYGGLVKGVPWDYEEETRIRIAIRPRGLENVLSNGEMKMPQPFFDSIYFELAEDVFNNIQIKYNPWATDSFKNDVKQLVLKNIPTMSHYSFSISAAEGFVKTLDAK